MKKSLLNSATNFNFLALVTAEDLHTEIRKLDDQISIAKDELRDIEAGHRERPYRPEFMTMMRRGYRSSLRELHREIENVRAMIGKSSVSVQL